MLVKFLLNLGKAMYSTYSTMFVLKQIFKCQQFINGLRKVHLRGAHLHPTFALSCGFEIVQFLNNSDIDRLEPNERKLRP